MKKMCYLYFSAAAIGLLMWSCMRYDQEPEPTQYKRQPVTLTTEEARMFFEDFRDSFSIAGNTKSDYTGIEQELLETLDWSASCNATLFGRDVVEIPFAGAAWAIVPAGDDPDPEDAPGDDVPAHPSDSDGNTGGEEQEGGCVRSNTAIKLIAGVDDYGEIYYNVLYITASDHFMESFGQDAHRLTLAATEDSFDGQLWLFSLAGNLLRGYGYREGRVVTPMSDAGAPGGAAVTRSFCRLILYEDYICGVNSSEGLPDFHWCEHIRDRYVMECDGGGGGGGGGDGGTGPTGPVGGGMNVIKSYPLAGSVFRNSGWTNEKWGKLEDALTEMLKDCLGRSLYNSLAGWLNGKTLIITNDPQGYSSFSSDGRINLKSIDDRALLHETWHANQAYNETFQSMAEAHMNMEVEAWYASYLYVSNQSYYVKGNYDYEQFETTFYGRAIRDLRKYIDYKGRSNGLVTALELDSIIAGTMEKLQKLPPYADKPYDYSRSFTDNFKNLRKLAKDC